MVSVKGPRSALTDFIEQHGIKIDKQQLQLNKETTIKNIRKVQPRQKRAKKSKPFELSNSENNQKSLQNILVENILCNLDEYELEDKHLEMISLYLSQYRKFNLDYFRFIVEKSKKALTIYDCSMIKDSDFIINNMNLTTLELHQCGQLSNYRCNEILSNLKNLEILRITGGYLLTEINLPEKLKILDLSNCNRISNSIITEINRKYKTLDELRLSYCYKITDCIKLKTLITYLYLEETLISENFYNVKNIRTLSVKNCQNINELKKNYKLIEYLNIENITPATDIKIGPKIKHLNLQRCYRLNKWIENSSRLKNIEYLNISYLKFDSFDFIYKLTNLKELDLSWCEGVSDTLIIDLIEKTKIEKIYVFGCFNLTSKLAEKSYECKNTISVVGNHAETKYLIENN
jgi:hypothetical protein